MTTTSNLEPKIFFCPLCKEIPSISFIIKNSELLSSVSCKCGSQSIPLSSLDKYLTSEHFNECSFCKMKKQTSLCNQCNTYYCSSCSLSHILSSNNCSNSNTQFKCLKHNNSYEYYCFDCKEDICTECKSENHYTHNVVIYSEILSINTLCKKTKELIDTYNEQNKKKSETKELIIKRLKEYIFTLEKMYEQNKKENEELFKYVMQLINSYNSCHDCLNYKIISNVKNNKFINKVNFEPYYYTDLFKNRENIFSYFYRNYFIKISSKCKKYSSLSTKKEIKAHSKKINCIIELNDGRIASCSDDCSIKIYSSADFSVEQTIKDSYQIRFIAQLSNGLLVSSSDTYISLWNIHPSYTSPILTFTPFPLDKIIQMLKLSNGTIALASNNRKISIWNLTEAKDNQVMEIKLSNNKDIMKIIEIKNNRILIGQNGMLSSFDYINNSIKEITTITVSENYSMANYNDNCIVIINKFSGFSSNDIALIFNIDTFQVVNQLNVDNFDFIYNNIYYYYCKMLFNPHILQETALVLKCGYFLEKHDNSIEVKFD